MIWIAALQALVACGELSDPAQAVSAAERSGFTQVKVLKQHGIAPDLYGCGKGDGVAFDLQATNPRGASVTLTACCGGPLEFKGCTLRY